MTTLGGLTLFASFYQVGLSTPLCQTLSTLQSLGSLRFARTVTYPCFAMCGELDAQTNIARAKRILKSFPETRLYIDPNADRDIILREESDNMVTIGIISITKEPSQFRIIISQTRQLETNGAGAGQGTLKKPAAFTRRAGACSDNDCHGDDYP